MVLANIKLASHILHGLQDYYCTTNFPRTTHEVLPLPEYTMAMNHSLLEEDGVL